MSQTNRRSLLKSLAGAAVAAPVAAANNEPIPAKVAGLVTKDRTVWAVGEVQGVRFMFPMFSAPAR